MKDLFVDTCTHKGIIIFHADDGYQYQIMDGNIMHIITRRRENEPDFVYVGRTTADLTTNPKEMHRTLQRLKVIATQG